jgi:CheY-like chemotaxis protein
VHAKVVIAVPDLIFRAKVRDAVERAGLSPVIAKNAQNALDAATSGGVALVVVDLADERVEPFATIRAIRSNGLDAPPIVGFFPHVRVELKEEAKRSGCDVVVPRSVFVERLEELLRGAEPRG